MSKNRTIINLNIKENNSEKKPVTLRENLKNVTDIFIFCICGLILGVILGAIDAFFGTVLLGCGKLRDTFPLYFIPFLFAAGLIIYFIYDRFGKETMNGMKLVFDRMMNRRTEIKLRLIPFVMISTWLTHLFGGSAGREGVAVQIGGTLGSFISQHLHIKRKNTARIMTITGMAGGFAGLFRTPMAAVFFSMEVLNAGKIEVSALLPALICSYTASFVSGQLGLEKFSVDAAAAFTPDITGFCVICFACILFGIVGGSFAWVIKRTKKLFSVILKNPYTRIAIVGAAVSAASLALYFGRYSGLGTNLISAAVSGGTIYSWDFLFKFLFTVVTVSAGFQGGEVTPLFAIGASLGAAIAVLFNMPVLLFAAMGYSAVFGAATNTLIAPMFIGVEVFGYQNMPFFFAACTIAYLCNGNQSIYPQRRLRITE